MLNWAGIAVTVDNAEDIIKKSADFVTLCNQSGVTYAIDNLV
ncbi:HAD hydrolase family protein [Lacrimispora sp.]